MRSCDIYKNITLYTRCGIICKIFLTVPCNILHGYLLVCVFISRSNMPNKKRNKNSMPLDAKTEEMARSVKDLFIFGKDKPTYSQIASTTLSKPVNNTVEALGRPDNNTCPSTYIDQPGFVCDFPPLLLTQPPPPPYKPVLNYQPTLPNFTAPPPVGYNKGPLVYNFPYTHHQSVIPHGPNTMQIVIQHQITSNTTSEQYPLSMGGCTLFVHENEMPLPCHYSSPVYYGNH